MKTKNLLAGVVSIALIIMSCSKIEDPTFFQANNSVQSLSINEEVYNASNSMNESEASTSLLQITLNWDSLSDLDLYVQDPTGEWIWHKHKMSKSKGQLNMDDRNGNASEIISWNAKDALSGNYKIFIRNYGGDLSKYIVTLQFGGEIKSYEGSIKPGENIFITEVSESLVELSKTSLKDVTLPDMIKN